MNYEHVARAVFSEPWAIWEGSREYAALTAVLEMRLRGEKFSAEELQARLPERRQLTAAPSGIAVLPLYGVLSQRMNLIMEASGGTSTEMFGKAFASVIADPTVKAVVLDVDSPGGSTFGMEELAEQIFRARGTKPIIAVANSVMASAAYRVAAAADQIVATPGALVGSIGVMHVHQDASAAAEREGVRTTFITSAPYKAEGNSFEPLSDEAREHLQALVDATSNAMVAGIAKARGVAPATVRGSYGQGRVFGAAAALERKMVDRIATLPEVLGSLAGRFRLGEGPRASFLETEDAPLSEPEMEAAIRENLEYLAGAQPEASDGDEDLEDEIPEEVAEEIRRNREGPFVAGDEWLARLEVRRRRRRLARVG